MRVPLRWLRELVAVEASTDEVGDRLAAAGVSVESAERVGERVSGVVVAKVEEVGDVVGARKPMWHAAVDAGDRGRFSVVAGAPIAAGDVVPFAPPGARVTTIPEPLAEKTMPGGHTSQGMLCSAYELGLGDDHSGIMRLEPGAALGADVAELLGLVDDVLELEITPNRPDLLSVLGVAREVAVLFDVPLRAPSMGVTESGLPVSGITSVEIEDPEGCPRYLARVVEDVTFGPSPGWVRARLAACGIRPLGNLVDATNYVLELTGQPLHAFDLDRLEGGRIVVRRARPDESLTTLDDVERTLTPDDLVIADAVRPQALAGVMGGADSEVGEGTRRVLIESAHFDPATIFRTVRRVDLRTGASQRFEKGTDPEMVPDAAALCAELLRAWAGGSVASGAIDAGSIPARRSIGCRRGRVNATAGIDIPDTDQDRILVGLGCDLSAGDGRLDVVVPSWRPDLEREIDLIEEITRIWGYDRIPMSVPHGERGFLTDVQLLRRRARDVLMGAGLAEATLSSFVADEDLALLGGPAAVAVANPLSSEHGHLRPSLLPGLLRAAQRNQARGVETVRLFERGTVWTSWSDGSELPDEVERLGFVLAGPASPPGWASDERQVDVFDAKGLVELLCEAFGVDGVAWDACDTMPFHPGRAATVFIGGSSIGRFGELRPSVARELDLTGGAVVGELDLEPLVANVPGGLRVHDVPHLPAVLRDVNLVVDDDTPAEDVRALIEEAAGELLESCLLLEVYRGEPVPEGRKSLVWRLTFRAPDRTLTAEEADAQRDAVISLAADRLGADLR